MPLSGELNTPDPGQTQIKVFSKSLDDFVPILGEGGMVTFMIAFMATFLTSERTSCRTGTSSTDPSDT